MHWVLSVLSALSFLSLVQAIECPLPDNDPVEVPKPLPEEKLKLKLAPSKKHTVCMLARVSLANETASLDDFSLASKSSDYVLAPVARSYHRKPWQSVAGPYSDKVKVSCEGKKLPCTLRISPDAKAPADYKFFLMTFENRVTNDDEIISKFFKQATFGTTRAMISEFHNKTYTANKKGFARWVKDQVNTTITPMTGHRAYFRSRADFAIKWQQKDVGSFVSQHPCDQYSRWRNYPFTGAGDYGAKVNVVPYGDKFLLIVYSELQHGAKVREVRGVIDRFYASNDAGNAEYSGAGWYLTGYGMGEGLNQQVWYRPADSQGKPVAGKGYKEYTQTEIKLTDELLNDAQYNTTFRVIDLPPLSNFTAMIAQRQPERAGGRWTGGGSHRMDLNLWETNRDQCASLGNNFQRLVGRSVQEDGTVKWLHYHGYADIPENTVESPLFDGGASRIARGLRTTYNVAPNFLNIDGCRLSNGPAYLPSKFDKTGSLGVKITKNNTIVCGSHGEVGKENDMPFSKASQFQMWPMASSVFFGKYDKQKVNVFFMTALEGRDQLRQRMAFALSQILVVTQFQLDTAEYNTEFFLNYHDIFVRNAFGSYWDILKEVSYSPLMGEMLSFIESRSSAYVAFTEGGRESRPDENYAREIMQLFTIGTDLLNDDGTVQTDEAGNPIPSYDNTDIQTFARAWTGFKAQKRRGNREGYDHSVNRIDPMSVEGERRDQFPKMNLYQGFIGDNYPLCEDLPEKSFLRKGAYYYLRGSYGYTDFHSEPKSWINRGNIERFNATVGGDLYNALCQPNDNGECNHAPRIQLKENLPCSGDECSLDNLRLIQINDVFYEYVRPACVELSFDAPENLKKVVDYRNMALCLNKKIPDGASSSCCTNSNNPTQTSVYCKFTAERTTYDMSVNRCAARGAEMCQAHSFRWPDAKCNHRPDYFKNYYPFVWTSSTCEIQARVGVDGVVALVHEPAELNTNQKVFERVDVNNTNYFKVDWEGGEYPSPDNNCGALPSCQVHNDDCLCKVVVNENSIFSTKPDNAEEVISRLKIGAPNPKSFDKGVYRKSKDSTNQVLIYNKVVDGQQNEYKKTTIFGVKIQGKRVWFKNTMSDVSIEDKYSFRNPPRFMSLTSPETRDAIYETDEVLNHLFYHPNTPTFVAIRLLKRFGVSNPSPSYIRAVSKAFKTGTYGKKKWPVQFGNGNYGNLEATIAAILIHQEVTTPALDKYPSSGAIRETLISYISLMRNMEFKTPWYAKEMRMEKLDTQIAQMPYYTPSVFSFFLDEYAAPGQIIEASLTSPEAQILNSPTIIGFLNGAYSLIETGLNRCYGGFGNKATNNCDRSFVPRGNSLSYTDNPATTSFGTLTFNPTSTNSTDIVDEISMIMTGGMMSSKTKEYLVQIYDSEKSRLNEGYARQLLMKAIVTSPEFHVTNQVQNRGENRPDPEVPVPSTKQYKSIVIVNLNGGMDSFNMLYPKCATQHANYVQARGVIGLRNGRAIDATGSNQVCDQFQVHNSLPTLQSLYNSNDLAFVANLGILQRPADKSNWRRQNGGTKLFAHNTQTDETAYIDIADKFAGRGVGGRILDVLKKKGFKTGAVSVAGTAPPVASKSTPLLAVNPYGYEKYDTRTWTKKPNIRPSAKTTNNAANVGSSMYADVWSDLIYQSVAENDLLSTKYTQTQLTRPFPSTKLGVQFASVSKLMKTKDVRGVDRDVFFIERPGWDDHANVADPLQERFAELDAGLKNFAEEMKASNLWDSVTVVLTSEFSRTLKGNAANGTDHAWGGNYFVAGGSIKGKKILGSYPSDLTTNGPLVFSPGIVIPTTPWEGVWHAVSKWFGVDDEDIPNILPNIGSFETEKHILQESDLFETGSG